MLTSKQRSYLKGIAHNLDPIVYIGKDGLSENVIKELDTCLESKELIKVKIQDGCELEPKATANDVAARLNAEFVQAIGHKFSIYRQSNTLPIEKRINLKLAK